MHVGIFNLIHPKMKQELKEIYINRILRALGFSIISVFVPIYLLNLNFLLNEVLFYLFGAYFFLGLFSFLASYLESKIGVKHTLSIGTFFSIIFFIMLFTIGSMNWPLSLIAFIQGLALSLFWIPFNANFVKSADKGKYGTEIGLLVALPHTIGVIGPLLGVLVILYFGFDILLILACIILILSVMPFFFTKDIKPRIKRIKNLFHRRNLNYFDLYIVKGIISGVMAIWPIFIFYVASDYLTIGIVDSLKGFAAVVFTFIVGAMCDRIKLSHIFKIAGVLNIIVWTGIFLTSNSPSIFILSFLIGFVYIFVSIPIFVLSTMVAQKTPTEFMVFREIALSIGRCSIIALMILLPFEDKFRIPFIIVAIVSIYLMLFNTKRVDF